LQQIAELFFPRSRFQGAHGAAIGLRQECELRALADEFEQISGRRFDESRAEEYVVVNVVDADSQ
jgi:hypothetical protein